MNTLSRNAGEATTSRFDQSRHLNRRPVTLRSIGTAIRRRWIIVAACMVALFIAGLAAGLLLTPKYDAYTKVRIAPSSRSALDVDSTQDRAFDQNAVNTEAQVMGSRNVARRVVQTLHLDRDPEFVPLEQQPRVGGSAADIARAVEQATTVAASRVRIDRDEKSYIVRLGFRSNSPTKAAEIANAFAQSYIANTADTLVGTATRQSVSLQQRLSDLGAQVQTAEARVAQYRAQTGITPGGGGGTVTDQQVGPLSSQLATAESEAAAARSNIAVAEQQIARGGIDSVSAVLASPVIADLRRQRTEAEKKRAEYSSRYGPRYPLSVQVAQQIESLDEQVRIEARRIIEGLRSEARAAQARAGSLRAQLNALKGNVARDDRAAVQADAYERDAEAKRSAYTRLAQAAQQSNQAERSAEPQSVIIENATIPGKPSFPNTKAFAAAGLLLGLVVGLGTVLAIEGVTSTVRTAEDVELTLTIPFLASIPRLPAKRGKQKTFANPAETLINKPMTIYAEAYRSVRSAIIAIRKEKPVRVVAVASTLPGEGKTTSALSLARIMALSGDRTLLIDCDIRRAGVARAVRRNVEVGVEDVMSGEAALDDALIEDAIPKLDLLLVKRPLFTATDVFGDDNMQKLLAVVVDRYDFVILDTPPLLGIADARKLAAVADGVALVVKWNSTPVPAIDAALASLEQDGATVFGGILSMVDPRAEAMGAFYYSSRYGAYYQE